MTQLDGQQSHASTEPEHAEDSPTLATTDIAVSSWPMNAWYAAAYDVEVGRRLGAFRVAGLPVVLHRKLDGRPVALADACWHRLAPLSRGSLCGDGDEVRCGYHGIRYGADGSATRMPA